MSTAGMTPAPKPPTNPLSALLSSNLKSTDDTAAHFRRILSTTSGVDTSLIVLGYGSNLSAETFRGKRGIRPLSQVNVVVPEIALAFNLPGVPYSEPCFANTVYRTVEDETSSKHTDEYHKDRWHKGLVGVVYEVTKEDFAHIIATE